MTRLTAALLVLLLACVVTAERTEAYTFLNDGWGCSGGNHWNVTPTFSPGASHACHATECGGGAPLYTMERCSHPNTTADRDVFAWSAWMWTREYRLRVAHTWDQAHCYTGGFSDTDSVSVWGYQTGSIPDHPDGLADYYYDPPVACIGGGHSHFDFGGDFRFKTDSAWVNSGSAVVPPNNGNGIQDLLVEYFLKAPWKENGSLHEIGHAYGLNHDNTSCGVMNSRIEQAKGVRNLGAGNHIGPDGDAMQGASKHNGNNTSYVFNFGGTAWTMNGASADSNPRYERVDPPGGPWPANYTFNVVFSPHSYYQGITNVTYRFKLIMEGHAPPEYGPWTSTHSFWNAFGFASNARNQVLTKAVTIPANDPFILAGVEYRLWVQMDSVGVYTETDEGDNWFPLNVIFWKKP